MRGSRLNAQAMLLVAAPIVACGGTGDPSDAGAPRPATTCADACGQWRALGDRVGCSRAGCECEPRCAQEMSNLIECLGQDLSQCYCESDDEPNCEGGWKQSEGPALCIEQLTAFRSCADRPSGECAAVGERCVDADCCDGDCFGGFCMPASGSCAALGESCAGNDCCADLTCDVGSVCNTHYTCAMAGQSCASTDCCEGLACTGSVCGP